MRKDNGKSRGTNNPIAAHAGPSVACPHCGKPALYAPANPFRPFCCERCRLIDLGAWAKESYRIAEPAPADGTLGGDSEDP
jgi:endogenous inhibitor of DNA gyrase (YacG/DUF329 family)